MRYKCQFSVMFKVVEVDRQYVFLSQWIELRVIVGLGVFPYEFVLRWRTTEIGT